MESHDSWQQARDSGWQMISSHNYNYDCTQGEEEY